MKIIYILNESCFYMRMAWFSLTTLRKFNPEIPVEILFICDNEQDSRYISNYNDFDLGLPVFNKDIFIEECVRKFNVKFNVIYNLDMKEEAGYHPVQRIAFKQVADDQILLLDADTFIFGDLTQLFEILKEYQIVADVNEWSQYGKRLFYNGKVRSLFNSGVVLFNNGLLNDYGNFVYDMSLNVKGDIHPVGKWLGDYEKQEGTKGKLGREEISFSLFVYDKNLNYRYFRSNEVQTSRIRFKTLIHHTQTQHWIGYWKKYFNKGIFNPHFNFKYKLIN
jgi:hypothetical protein